MTSYERHIGPWPIKRSQSVPDTSASLFTPRSSPPSLARLLARVDEDSTQWQQQTLELSITPPQKKDWSEYNMQQPPEDLENGEVEKTPNLNKDERDVVVGVMVGGTKVLVLSTIVLVPAFLSNCFAGPGLIRIKLPEEVPLTVLMYTLIFMFTIMIGITTGIALLSFEMVLKKKTMRGRDIIMELPYAFSFGILLGVCWMSMARQHLVLG